MRQTQTLQDADNLNYQGIELCKQGRLTEALEYFNRTLEIRQREAPDSLALADYVLEYHQKCQELPSIEYCSSEFGITTPKEVPAIITYQHPLSSYNQLGSRQL